MRPFDDVNLNRTLYLIDYEKNLRMRELEMRRRQFLHSRLNKRPRAIHTDVKPNQRREELRRRIQREKDAESQYQATLLKRKTELINVLNKGKNALQLKPCEGNSFEAKQKEVEEDEESPQQVDAAHEWPEYKLTDHNRVINLYQKSFEIMKRKKETNRNTFVESVNSILHKLRDKEENPKDPLSSLSKSILNKFVDNDFEKNVTHNDQDVEVPQGAASEYNIESTLCLPDDGTSEKPNEGDNIPPKSKIDDRKEKNEKQVFQKSPSVLDLWATVSKRQMEVRGFDNKKEGTRRGTLNSPQKIRLHGKESVSHADNCSGKEGVSQDVNKGEKEGGGQDVNKGKKEGGSQDVNKGKNEGVSQDVNKGKKEGGGQDVNKGKKEGGSQDVNKGEKEGGSQDVNKSRKEGVSQDANKSGKEGVSHDGNKGGKEGVSHGGNKSRKEGVSHDGNKIGKETVSHGANRSDKEGLNYDRESSGKKRMSLDGNKRVEVGVTHVDEKSGEERLNHEGNNKKIERIFQLTGEKPYSSLLPRRSIINRMATKDFQHSQESFTSKQEAPREQDAAEIETGALMRKFVSHNSSPRKSIPCKTKRRKDPKLAGIRNRNGDVRKSLTDDCIEECDETSTPNTVVVIHDESNNPRPSIQWDEGFRYSVSLEDNEENSRKQGEVSGCTSETVTESTPVVADADGSDYFSLLDLHQISEDNGQTEFLGAPLCQRSDVLGSPLSMNTASDIRSNDRSLSIQGDGGKRKLSMQTRGSLRALYGVMREDNRRLQQMQDEIIHPESTTYKTIVEALSGAAADADEHTQRLEKIRQAGLGLQTADREFSRTKSSASINERDDKGPRNNLRRNTIEAPGRSTVADVTDPVYKFLQRRSQSKTTRRHKTLSNVELKLLAHAPGEDITGRRHSFSSQQSSRRSSRSVMSGSNAERMSASSRSRKVSADASAFLENEWEQSQKDSAREGSEMTRPTSVAMSDFSLSDIEDFQGKRKDSRSYSWAPDVSETKEWHVLAMELLARRGKGLSKFRTVSHMLQWLGEEYRRQTAAMMYEELRYCSYLRLPKHQQPVELAEWDVETIFASESPGPQKLQD